MKIAICMAGHMRSYKECYSNFQNNFANHDIDIFLHTWDIADPKGWGGHFESYDRTPINFHDVYETYQPLKIVVENSSKLTHDPRVANLLSNNVPQASHNAYRVYNMFRKMKASFDLVDNPNDYDLVVRYRPDIIIEGLDLNNLNLEKITIQDQFWGDHWFQNFPFMVNDYFAVGKPDFMRYYFSLITRFQEFKDQLPFHPEIRLGWHIKEYVNKIPLKIEIIR